MKKLTNKKIAIFSIVIIVTIGGIALYRFFRPGYIPPSEGYVPDAETAIRIAEAIWVPIYGEDIYDKQPFVAEYNNVLGRWTVKGTLPEGVLGGVPEARIRKRDGKILFVLHGL